jgi:hypothetical protein
MRASPLVASLSAWAAPGALNAQSRAASGGLRRGGP